jgi:hypothetical protein
MRYALALVCLLFAARAHAASISVGVPQDNAIEIQPVYVDPTDAPTSWAVKSPTGPNPVNHGGWQPLGDGSLTPFSVDTTEAEFLWMSWQDGTGDFATVDVAEFVAAGDATVTMRVDSDEWGLGDWHIITWESPNLGVVTRTYFRTPEPASAALLALCPLALRRRRI